MKKIKLISLLLISICSYAQQIEFINIELIPEIEYQTIHNFGASDAWSTQFVGNWPSEKKESIANLLFSLDLETEGSPKGIGLSAWRFNIGAGSAEQGEESKIKDSWRRAEGFLQNDLNYNWHKQAGQQWFLQAAKNRGVKQFIAFVNSPPIQFTINNKAFSANGLSANISSDDYKNYAVYLAEIIQHFKENSQIEFNYVSPFNEPQWEWTKGNQEGSPWNNDEIFNASKIIDSVFQNRNIHAKLEITEAGSIDYLTSEKEKFKNRSNQITTFFNSKSELYIGDLKSLAPKFAGHSYFTTWNISKLKLEREKITKKLKEYPDLEYWMTEYCVLENNEQIKGGKQDLFMQTALYVARVIHSDLTIANASAWHWWLAMSPYNFKDGLIYHDKNKEDGNFTDSKLLWALGNYSRFIRPEAKRIHINYEDINSIENLKTGVLISAYKNIDKSIVVVIVNQKKEDILINIKDLPNYNSYKTYTTNKQSNLKFIGLKQNGNKIFISKESVNTLILN